MAHVSFSSFQTGTRRGITICRDHFAAAASGLYDRGTVASPARLPGLHLQAAPDAFAFILIVPQPFDRSGHGASIFYIQFQPNARFKNSSQ